MFVFDETSSNFVLVRLSHIKTLRSYKCNNLKLGTKLKLENSICIINADHFWTKLKQIVNFRVYACIL